MAYDLKRAFPEYYLPPQRPVLVTVPEMHFLSISGVGDPNEEGGAYKAGISALYALAYTLKMSKKGEHRILGYCDFVVPPLEGLWWQEGTKGIDLSHKAVLKWCSMIRLPDFVTEADVDWAREEAGRKKKAEVASVRFLTYEEGSCVQCMHIGPYDEEFRTIQMMHRFMEEEGYQLDIGGVRRHHEIYLSDARRVAPEKRRTVIRHPIRRAEEVQR